MRDDPYTPQDESDLGTRGTENQGKGKLDQLGGKLQEGVGRVTGNKDMEAEGKSKQLGGKVQEGMGGLQQKADDLLHPDR